ncbi:MAG TPA: sensor histidine kinase KdpD [Candidatus Methylomirabilis sp.]|nr:sensor histidine kinase KdpD [Candidatus Methylomirabilis sp.]
MMNHLFQGSEPSPNGPGAEPPTGRGTLTVFLGAAPGTGKTLAMMQAAGRRQAAGADVVVGQINTHGRPEMDRLLEGLECLPRRLPAPIAGGVCGPLDLDAAIARRPTVLVVDELASANPPASRHTRRWQDVEELLDTGISVFTTLNVYELESLKDVASRVTDVVVEDTVPDRVIEQADEIVLIDLPLQELLARFAEGKVHVPGRDPETGRRLFRPGTLMALRELALHRTADHVDARMRRYMHDHAIQTTWPVTERVLACISPSPHATQVVRAAKRFADTLRAEWLVVYVETPAHARLGQPARGRIAETLRLAEQLGAKTMVLSGQRVAEEVLAFARARNASKIIVGKSLRPLWQRLVSGSITDALLRRSQEADIYVISNKGVVSPPMPHFPRLRWPDWSAWAWPLLMVAVCTGLNFLISPYLPHAALVLVYLLGVVAVAARSGPAPSILACVLSVAAFDFFLVPPYYTFAVAEAQDLLTFGAMFVVALVISGLTVRIRWLADSARQREARTAALYAMSRDLASAREVSAILEAAVRHIGEVFHGQVTVLLPGAGGSLHTESAGGNASMSNPQELELSQWVYLNRQGAGLGTGTSPEARAVYLPLTASRGTLGVLGFQPDNPRSLEAPEQVRQLETFGSQVALALERAQLAAEAQQAQVRMETESMRSSLLSSVSHDLRTPLATITGTASSLLEGDATLDPLTRKMFLETLYEEAERLNRLVRNLLDMTRLQSGALHVSRQWHPLEEVIGSALGRMEKLLRGRPVATRLPEDLPLVPIDDVLVEQVLINLLENAIKYTPSGSEIELTARMDAGMVTVGVADRGSGIPPGDEGRVFEKFYRGRSGASRGAGLGLAICRGIVEAHGGRIWAENRRAGGAIFQFTIPLKGRPPDMGHLDG